MDIGIIFFTPVLLVALGFAITKLRRLSWRDDVGFRLPTARQAAWWSAGFLALAVAAEIVGSASGLESPRGSWRDKYDAIDLAVRIVAVGLLYPLAEEFFFRGALLGVVARRFGPTVGVILSSAAFAAMHVQYDWRGMVFVLADGLFFAFCRVRTGSLYLPMFFHVCGNSYAVWERIYG